MPTNPSKEAAPWNNVEKNIQFFVSTEKYGF